jgi:hypothetical protein
MILASASVECEIETIETTTGVDRIVSAGTNHTTLEALGGENVGVWMRDIFPGEGR